MGRKTEEQRDKSECRLPTASLACPSYWPQVNLLVQLRGLPFPPPVGDHLRSRRRPTRPQSRSADHLVYDADDVAVDHQKRILGLENVGAGVSWSWVSGRNPTLALAPSSGPPHGGGLLPGLVGVISMQISGNLSTL